MKSGKVKKLKIGHDLESHGHQWGFMRTFSGNQDATLKCMSELTYIDPESKGCLEKAKTTKRW